jgi:hypothetical protein
MSSVEIGYVLDDCKAEPGPSLLARPALVDPIEALEHPGLIAKWYAHAGI